MAVPFQFGALDQFSKAGLSTALEAEALTRSSGDFLARLQAANAADTAPSIGAPQVRGAGLAGAIGAALTNIVDPGAAERFANAERQVRAQNAQLQAQADLANQQQQGYLQMRKDGRDQLAAKLMADMEEIRAKAKAKMDELGIMRDTARIDKEAQAQQKQREADAMANSKWYQEHGQNFERLRTMIETGVQGVDAEGNAIPLKLEERRSLMDALNRMAITAPTMELRENIQRSISNLDTLLEGLGKVVEAPPPPPPQPSNIFPKDALFNDLGITSWKDAIFGTRTSGDIANEVEQYMTRAVDVDLLRGLVDTDFGQAQAGGLTAAPDSTNVQNFLGTFNEIYQRRQAEVNQALDQVAPTRRR